VNGWLTSALHPALIHAGNGPDDAVPRVICRFVGRMQLNLWSHLLWRIGCAAAPRSVLAHAARRVPVRNA